MRFGYMIAFFAATVAAMPRGEIKQVRYYFDYIDTP